MRAFTRRDIAYRLATEFSIQACTAQAIVNSVIGSLQDGLVQTGRVALRDFGVLEIRTRKPHIGRNPRKPDEADILIPARRVVKFRTGRALDAKLNSGI